MRSMTTCCSRLAAFGARIAFVVALTAGARAQADGDIAIALWGVSPQLQILSPTGAVKVTTTVPGTGMEWLGAELTRGGLLATTRRFPNGINLFGLDGLELATFDTPEVGGMGEVNVFADGTLAVSDYQGGVQLYSEAGVHLGTLVAPSGMFGTFGGHVDDADTLWVCSASGIHRFARDGTLLGAVATGSFRAWDVDVPGDGTLWTTRSSISSIGRVVRFAEDGTELASFTTGLTGWHYGIAVADDGTLLVSVWQQPALWRFDQAGNPLGSVPLASATVFVNVLGAPPPPVVPYCTAKTNSLGCRPAIRSFGLPRASGDSGFTVSATNVRNAKLGLLLYTLSGRALAPFQGGVLCLAPPVLRTPPTLAGGPPPPLQTCDGGWRLDMNAFAAGLAGGAPHPGLRVPGTGVHCQWWGRDPGDPFGSSLSDALQYEVAP